MVTGAGPLFRILSKEQHNTRFLQFGDSKEWQCFVLPIQINLVYFGACRFPLSQHARNQDDWGLTNCMFQCGFDRRILIFEVVRLGTFG